MIKNTKNTKKILVDVEMDLTLHYSIAALDAVLSDVKHFKDKGGYVDDWNCLAIRMRRLAIYILADTKCVDDFVIKNDPDRFKGLPGGDEP